MAIPLSHDVVVALFLASDHVEPPHIARGDPLRAEQHGCRAREVLAPTLTFSKQKVGDRVLLVHRPHVQRIAVVFAEMGDDALDNVLVARSAFRPTRGEIADARIECFGSSRLAWRVAVLGAAS